MESDAPDAPLQDIEQPVETDTADATTSAQLEVTPVVDSSAQSDEQGVGAGSAADEPAVPTTAAPGVGDEQTSSSSGEPSTQQEVTDPAAGTSPSAAAAEAGAADAEAAAADAACVQDSNHVADAQEGAADTSAEAGPVAQELVPAGEAAASPEPPATAQTLPGTGFSTAVSRPLSSLPPAASTAEEDECHVAYFEEGVRAIDVEVDCGPGLPCRLVHVVIDVSSITAKPYMGGYRHKGTGTTLHHAASQTPKAPPPAAGKGSLSQKLERTTQTTYWAASSAQTVREAGTQMTRPGLLVDESGDRLLSPRPYFTSQQLDAKRWAATLTIQRYARGWAARQRAATLRRHKDAREGFLEDAAAAADDAAETKRRDDLSRRLQPLSPGDFKLLTGELETWRKQERDKIKAAGLASAQEQAALQLLLAKETRLLQTIDKLRVGATAVAKEKRADRALTGMAAPVTWELRNGAKVEVHTPATVRAQELQQLYRGLNLTQLTVDERLDVLLHVKWTVKEFDCALTRELVELIDREADLVNRGRNPSTLEGLRKRISSLFLTFCTTPAFNPEAARFQVRPAGVPTAVVAEPEDETFVFTLEDVKGPGATSSGRLGGTTIAAH